MVKREKLKYLLLAIILFLSCSPLISQTLPNELEILVGKLKASPSDIALREQVIKTANEIMPAPTIPETARENFVQGRTLFKSAKDVAGQKLAVESFREALRIAPWWGDAYYNLAIAQELAGQYDDAQISLKFYIFTNPGEKEARDAQDKIYEFKAKKKLADAEAAQKEAARRAAEDTPEAREKRFFDRLEGGVFTWYRFQPADQYAPDGWTYRVTILVRNREMIMLRADWRTGLSEPDVSQGKEVGRIQLRANVSVYSYKDSMLAQDHSPVTVNIGSDMRSIMTTSTWYTHKYTNNFSRVR